MMVMMMMIIIIIIIQFEKYLTKNCWFITYSARWMRKNILENNLQQ